MAASDVAKAEIWEDGGCACLARVRGANGVNITSADVTSFTRKIFDLSSSTPDTAIHSTTVSSPTTSAIHSLATDSRWDEDGTGYNFENTILSSTVVFAKPNRRYRIQYTFTPSSTSEPTYHAVFEVTTKSIRGG
jgi:hypothetical protein